MKKIFLILTAAVLLFTMSSCANKVDEVVELIDSSSLQDALTVFSESKLDSEEQAELVEKLGERLDAVGARYANGEIEYELAKQTINAISYMSSGALSDKAYEVSSLLDDLSDSKVRYSDGMEAFNEGNYVYAASCFAQVIEEDPNYATAQAKATEATDTYINSVISEAREYAAAGDYNEAIDVLEYALYEDIDTTKISEEITAIEQQKKDSAYKKIKDEALANASDLAKDGNLEDAMILLREFIEDNDVEDADIEGAYNTYKTEYVTLMTGKIEKLRTEQKYIRALDMLENARLVAEDAQFDALAEAIKAEKPIYLSDIKYQNGERYEAVTKGESVMDTIGNTYSVADGNLFKLSADSWDDGFVDYYLGYKYDMVHGYIAVDDTSYATNATLVFEGDGTVLFSLPVDRLTVPTRIDIIVSEVNYLKIKLVDAPSWDDIHVILSGFYFDKPAATAAE